MAKNLELWQNLGRYVGTLANTIKALQEIEALLGTRRAKKVPEAKAIARAAINAAFGKDAATNK
jgi:hypothetical protein